MRLNPVSVYSIGRNTASLKRFQKSNNTTSNPVNSISKNQNIYFGVCDRKAELDSKVSKLYQQTLESASGDLKFVLEQPLPINTYECLQYRSYS